MATRGHNPLRAVRWGTVVILAAAGTLAALVVSEWPQTGEMIASQASPSGARRGAVVGAWSARIPRAYFMPDEPDSLLADWPGLVAAGSAEEARREVQELADRTPPPSRHSARGCANTWDVEEVQHPTNDLNEYIDWWASTPTGRLVEEISAYDPARSEATMKVTPMVDLTAGMTKYNTRDGPSVGRIEQARSGAAGESEVYDLSVRFDALGDSSTRGTMGFGMIGGLRAASVYDRLEREQTRTDPLRVVGGDARIKWSERSMLRASAVGEVPGTPRDYLDLRLEQVWRLGADASLSLGWRHLRGILSNETPEPTLRQDAILLELKIGF